MSFTTFAVAAVFISAPGVGQFAVYTTAYATAQNPMGLSFDGSGNLYAGKEHHEFGQGGSSAFAIILRVSSGSSSALDFGPLVSDPDTVLVDRSGVVSGTPDAVLVGGYIDSSNSGRVTIIRPDQSSAVLFDSTDCHNINAMAIDSAGRLIICAGSSTGQPGIFSWSQGSLVRLVTHSATPVSVALDDADNAYVSFSDGRIRVYDATGQLQNDSFVATNGNGLLAFGPGGLWGTELYMLEQITGELVRFDVLGQRTSITTSYPGSFAVEGLTFGSDGALYLSDWSADLILRTQYGLGGAVAPVGTGCGGAGMPVFGCNAPRIGQNVTLTLTQGTPNASGFVYYSAVPASPIVLGSGCIVELDLATFGPLLPVVADPSGSWGITVGPIDQGLFGLQAAMQIALFGTAGPLGFDLSNGLIATIGY